MHARRDLSEPAFVSPEPSGPGAKPILLRAPLRVVLAGFVVRYLLAATLSGLGALIVSGAVADAIQPIVDGSPALSWLYGSLGVTLAARVAGSVALVAALLLFLSPVSRPLAFAGSLLAVGIFAVSLSLAVTTPGCFVTMSSFPLPVPTLLGAFFLKDIFPFCAASWSLIDLSRALRR